MLQRHLFRTLLRRLEVGPLTRRGLAAAAAAAAVAAAAASPAAAAGEGGAF
jgi:hypothetical protein